MNKYKLQIPEGVQDYLVDEQYNKLLIEDKIRKIFDGFGYDEIDTPVFEYYDVFSGEDAIIDDETMFKFFDKQGRILVLRPDMTTPIARMAATKLYSKPLPIRLSYISNVFRYDQPQSARQREFTQAGVELLGSRSPQADAEVISLAITILERVGLKNFQIELGQVEFFKSIINGMHITQQQVEEFRALIEEKNMIALEGFLDDLELPDRIRETVYMLPKLYGGMEVINKAAKLTSNTKALEALRNLESIYCLLKDGGLEQYVSIDLGMVSSLQYYTGTIFKGFTRELGFTLLGGGRYDALMENFGQSMPATGFAVGIKRILVALERQDLLTKKPTADFLLTYHKGLYATATRIAQRLRDMGCRVEMDLEGRPAKELLEQGRHRGIATIIEVKSERDIAIKYTKGDRCEVEGIDEWLKTMEIQYWRKEQ
ncbi:MAG: ATP phosphoribosyltransferase regulatory subunit [Mahellales bacterium]